MSSARVAVMAAAVVSIIAVASAAQAQQEPPVKGSGKVPGKAAKASPKDKMPAPIRAAFEKAYPNAIVKSVSSEKEGGATVWEVESTDNGKTRDLIYKPDGTVLTIEDGIDESELPAPVRQSITAKYPKGKIVLPERVTKGAEVFYEMVVQVGGTKHAVAFNADGQPHVDKVDKKQAAPAAPKKK